MAGGTSTPGDHRALNGQAAGPDAFRAALLAVAPAARDAWLDAQFGLRDLPEDGSDLPRGCVPYLPSPVDALLRTVEQTGVCSSDVFVDVGAGLGRAAAFVQLITGAEVVGIEVQPGLVRAARELARRLALPRLSFVEGDAAELPDVLARGSVFFFYCPFSGERLRKVLGDLEAVARGRPIRIACLDLPLPPCPWLDLELSTGALTIHRSVGMDRANAARP